MRKLTDAERDRARQEVIKRIADFKRLFDSLCPDNYTPYKMPEAPWGVAVTAFVHIVFTKGRRTLNFDSVAVKATVTLSDREKEMIGNAVAKAAYESGLEAMHKPTWSDPERLCYRIFYKI